MLRSPISGSRSGKALAPDSARFARCALRLHVSTWLLAGCSLLIDPPHYEECAADEPPRCSGDELVACEGGFPVTRLCAFGCDPSLNACNSGCGDGTVQPPEVCDDMNRDDGDACSADCDRAALDRLLNTSVLNDQDTPALAYGASRFTVVFEDESMGPPDVAPTRIRAVSFDECGDQEENEFHVYDSSSLKQETPSIAGGANTYFVAWVAGDSSTKIRGRVLEADGSYASAELDVSSSNSGTTDDPAVAAGPDGYSMVVWLDGRVIIGRIFTPAGGAATAELPLSAATSTAAEPAIAFDGARDFVVIWVNDGTSIEGRVVNVEGGLSPSFAVSTRAEVKTAPAIALGEGRLLAAWSDEGTAVVGRMIDKGGGPVGTEDFTISPAGADGHEAPAIVAYPGQRFMVTWTRRPPGDSNVVRNFVDIDGRTTGEPERINTITKRDQKEPATAIGPGGTLVVWEDTSEVPPDTSLDALRYRFIPIEGGPCE